MALSLSSSTPFAASEDMSSSLSFTEPMFSYHDTRAPSVPFPFGVKLLGNIQQGVNMEQSSSLPCEANGFPVNTFVPFLGKNNCGFEDEDEVMGEDDYDLYDSFEDAEECVDISLYLPEEILVRIFKYLDTKSFCAASSVCQNWRAVAGSPCLWWMRCDVIWNHLLYMSQKTAEICHQILLDSHLMHRKKYQTRIKFLTETLGDVMTASRNRLENKKDAHYNVESYYMMSNVLLSQLYDSNGIVQGIRENPAAMTVNFDILDISIRKYIRQLDSMFPILSSELQPQYAPPSHIIKDEKARFVWEKFVGKNQYHAKFTEFYENVLLSVFPQLQHDSGRFRDIFQFFVNFPRDDMMTTYKWAVIINQFGPFDQFVCNFQEFACGNGFLGLINCVEAEEHLQGPNTFLLRFSRKEPEKLTFSFKVTNASHVVVCHHKRKPCGVPIRQFIVRHFDKAFSPVQKHLGKKVTQIDRIDQFCEVSGYLIDSSIVPSLAFA